MRMYIVYWFCCLGYKAKYIGKTTHSLETRLEEHAGSDLKSSIYNYLVNCSNYKHTKTPLHSYSDLFNPGMFDLHFVL